MVIHVWSFQSAFIKQRTLRLKAYYTSVLLYDTVHGFRFGEQLFLKLYIFTICSDCPLSTSQAITNNHIKCNLSNKAQHYDGVLILLTIYQQCLWCVLKDSFLMLHFHEPFCLSWYQKQLKMQTIAHHFFA